jgi:TPR repeat protein
MEDTVRQELLAKTKQALDADDWNAVECIWRPWIEQGDAEFQLGYHYLWCNAHKDDPTRERMEALVDSAAAKDHPDAIWFFAERLLDSQQETTSESERLLLRAGQLGSVKAQARLAEMYATGDWSWPVDLVKAAHWYRLAAEAGDAGSQYELGFMLLLGEGEHKNTIEGLMWLERAGELGNPSACRLLADCYENGHHGVPLDAAKAALWRNRLEEYERLHPLGPYLRYRAEDVISKPAVALFMAIEGVTGFGYVEGHYEIDVYFDPARITPAELDEKVRAVGIVARRAT